MLLPHQLELLSPARDAAIGIEAIKHGADAVYIGAPSFGARASATNSVADIARLVDFAHRFHARIFATINTILRDDELEAARTLIWQLYYAGVDALIVQDMGLLELDLPPIQLHASTQCDIRTPEKAKFLQDVGFRQLVLARELTVEQIQSVHQSLDSNKAALEFFVHGALCVAYSGQCFISHAHTGRSANRGDCSQACRLPYTVTDKDGGIVAHEKHVLSLKDNNQSDNIAALIQAGIRSFKIEGRYKDMAYVKNITAHYRLLLDSFMEAHPQFTSSSHGKTEILFTPNPEQNFNRQSTDYFVQGRKLDIGAFDTPKHSGIEVGWIEKIDKDGFVFSAHATDLQFSNGDGFTYFDLQGELVGFQANRVEAMPQKGSNTPLWKIFTREAAISHHDLRTNIPLYRNKDLLWQKQMERESAVRRIPVYAGLSETDSGFRLTLSDAFGNTATSEVAAVKELASLVDKHGEQLTQQLSRLGGTDFVLQDLQIAFSKPWHIPASLCNALRRDAVAALAATRLNSLVRGEPGQHYADAVYPEDSLTYLANVYNQKAHDFYAKHGVKVIDAAYESHQELGEASLMITKHCVRFSLSLCPKQAKGVTGVQGTIRAEPLTLQNGSELLHLRFDCKACEMHVVGKIKKSVLKQAAKLDAGQPIQFYRNLRKENV